MKFTYTPTGGEPQSWNYDPDKLMTPEAEAIEKVTGMTFGEWTEAVVKSGHRATRALLWIYLKRQRPTLKFDQVSYSMSEVELDMDEQEIRDAIAEIEARLEGGVELSPEQAEALQDLRDSVPAGDDEPAADVEGKAPSATA